MTQLSDTIGLHNSNFSIYSDDATVTSQWRAMLRWNNSDI